MNDLCDQIVTSHLQLKPQLFIPLYYLKHIHIQTIQISIIDILILRLSKLICKSNSHNFKFMNLYIYI
jgi:hypothetical protein